MPDKSSDYTSMVNRGLSHANAAPKENGETGARNEPVTETIAESNPISCSSTLGRSP